MSYLVVDMRAGTSAGAADEPDHLTQIDRLSLLDLDLRQMCVACHDVPAIAIVGVTGLTSHYCLAKALSLADATVVIPLDFLRLPLIALMGFLIYGEALEIWVALGAVMVCFGNYLSVRRAR